MAKNAAPKPSETDPLFGFEQGGLADITRIVPWQVLEQRRLTRNQIPVSTEIAERQLIIIGKGGRRNKFLEKFKGEWLPFHQYEMTVAGQTLAIAVRNAAGAPGSGTRAVGDLLSKVDKYRHEASVAVETLEEALISSEDSEPLPDQVRPNFHVRKVLAEFLLAKNYFDLNDWHPRTRTPEEPNRKTDALLQRFVGELETIFTDHQLVELWKQVHSSQKARQRYWTNQLDTVKNEGIVKAAISHR